MYRLPAVILSFYFLIGLLYTANAQQSSTNKEHTLSVITSGNTYALIVGVSKYKYIRSLQYADKDADLFADFLRSSAKEKISKENLFLLKNDSANAGNFWSALTRINNKKLSKGDKVYIFFAGHGDGVKGLNEYYLLLTDCQPANDGNNYLLSLGAIDMYRLKNRIGLMTAKGAEVFLILDACRTNELPGGYASQVFTNSIIETKVGEISMLATGPGQLSIEDVSIGRGHGLFTYNLVDALSGKADKEEGDDDKNSSVGEVDRWVKKSVKQMSAQFKVTQEPFFCCADKTNMIIGKVDSVFGKMWNQLQQKNNLPADIPAKGRRANDVLVSDTSLLQLYNQFIEAKKENKLWGNNSADSYYEEMKKQFANEPLTEDARYMLASDFINFAQEKINLYLEGKDNLSIAIMKEKADSSASGFLQQELERMQKAASEKWTITAMMIQKAGKLLSNDNDSTLLFQLKPKINFLLARGYLASEPENRLNFQQALAYAQAAWLQDSTAAYTAECLALMYTYKWNPDFFLRVFKNETYMGTAFKNDTAFYYYRKANALAPRWASPYRSMALKLYGYHSIDSAKMLMQRAINLNPDDVNSYKLMGDLIGFTQIDSSLFYYRKALSLSPGAGRSEIYRKMSEQFLNLFNTHGNDKKSDSLIHYARMAILANPANVKAYMHIASAYNYFNKPDSVLPYALSAIRLEPANRYAYFLAIQVFNRKRMTDSVLYYSHQLLSADNSSGYAASEIGRYYDAKKNTDSAIYYFTKVLSLNHDKDYCRERLGYLIMAKNRNDNLPLKYFEETRDENPKAWRSYFNIACYYANAGNIEKSIEQLQKALHLGMKTKKQLLTDPYLEKVRQQDSFKALMAKYFPE